MKVLLIWETIPERTELYALEGELAELAISAAGQYVNAGKNNEQAKKLSEALTSHDLYGNGEVAEAFDITGFDKAVVAGFVL